MSLPLFPPPPPGATGAAGGGAVGPVIGVLAVVVVLGVAAGVVGRLCCGRRVFGYGRYDCEAWVERRCGACIDGDLEAPRPPPPQAEVPPAVEPKRAPANQAEMERVLGAD